VTSEAVAAASHGKREIPSASKLDGPNHISSIDRLHDERRIQVIDLSSFVEEELVTNARRAIS
jgi:hypothetical protein